MRDTTTPADEATSAPLHMAAEAEAARRRLRALLDHPRPVPARFGPDAETIELPAAAVQLLLDALEQLALGHAVALVPLEAELTTQQAASLLNVSRTHLVQLLDDGQIRHRKVGTHRRVTAEDVLAFRRETERRRRASLDELTAYDQELGLQ